jgi:hypothetical protein
VVRDFVPLSICGQRFDSWLMLPGKSGWERRTNLAKETPKVKNGENVDSSIIKKNHSNYSTRSMCVVMILSKLLTTSPRETPNWVRAEASLRQRWWVWAQLYLKEPYTTDVLSLQTFAALSRKLIGDKGTEFAEQWSKPSIDCHVPRPMSCKSLQVLHDWWCLENDFVSCSCIWKRKMLNTHRIKQIIMNFFFFENCEFNILKV